MMEDNFKRILAINPGSRYMALAVFEETELLEWGVKSIRGRSSREKIETAEFLLNKLVEIYDVDILALKEIHPSRSSRMLDSAVKKLEKGAGDQGLKVYRYSLHDVEAFFSPERINKGQLAEYVVAEYPFLAYSLERERKSLNPYHLRMFEAVALGMVCRAKTEHISKKELKT